MWSSKPLNQMWFILNDRYAFFLYLLGPLMVCLCPNLYNKFAKSTLPTT
jgi:hypothetical protein